MTDSLPAGPHRTILRGWAILAVTALALAGFALIVPAGSKMRWLEHAVDWPDSFFQKGLVAHVALSFIVWFLAVLAILAQTALRLPDRRDPALPGGLGLALAVIGTLAIAGAPFLKGAEASLNNYIPSIIHPVYFAGLALVAAGALLPVLTMLMRLTEPASDAETSEQTRRIAHLSLGLLFVAALAAIGLAAHQLGEMPTEYAIIERLFWGGGHLLQFVNVALLLVALDRLGRQAFNAPPMGDAATKWAPGALFLAGAAGLSIYGLTDIRTDAHIQAFTDLQYAFAVPVGIAVLGALMQKRRWRMAHRIPGRGIEIASLIAATLVFLLGCTLGLFVDGADTRTPAHYHGVIGGINIAFYGLFYTQFLPAIGRTFTKQRLAIAQIILYAVGQSLFVAGLFFAGGMGAARKTMGAGLDLDATTRAIFDVRDFGLAIAVLSTAGFIVAMLIVLIRQPKDPAKV
ncbi:MAG: putative cytochrome c oxidase, subunit [Rhodospirillales bacterium]|jgi:heme/copper-type cytochrome/quinol oxidase subunit 1|nr:putative cytochrome c oxidase, subunit [Rhodospirillales bacterium]